jgi:hypothetical protein
MAVEEQYGFGRDIFGTQWWMALNQDSPSSRRKLGSSNKVFAFLSVFSPAKTRIQQQSSTSDDEEEVKRPSSWAS